MARLTVDYEDGYKPSDDAIDVIGGMEIIRHFLRTTHSEERDCHIVTMCDLLKPAISRLCECDVVPELAESNAA